MQVLQNRPDIVIAQAVWVFRIMFIDDEFIPIISIQPIKGSKPQKTGAVLIDRVY